MNVLALVRIQIERNREGLIKRLTDNSERQPKRFDQEVGCLLWLGRVNNYGYGRLNFWHNGRHVSVYVHHVSLALFTGEELPEGHERDHKCNVRHCFEPTHVEIVTHAENLRRARERRMGPRVSYAQVVAEMESQRAG